MGNKVDTNRSEAFAERLLGVLNSGGLSLMISIGHRTGLFDAMCDMPPSTSDQIAGAAGLNERYVREWLGAMLTGAVVECDSQGRLFSLPPEHAAWLTRKSAPSLGLLTEDNIAVFAQYIPLLGTVEDQIVECFRT